MQDLENMRRYIENEFFLLEELEYSWIYLIMRISWKFQKVLTLLWEVPDIISFQHNSTGVKPLMCSPL